NQLFYANRDTIEQYDIRLIARNACGVDTLVKNVTVFPPDVEAFIELDTLRVCQGLDFQLKSESTPGAAIFWRVLNSSGAVVQVINKEDPIIRLNNAGIHTFILSASNCGTDTDTAQIEVLSRPNLGFSVKPSTCVGQEVQFNNRANPDVISGSIWDFGDGQTSNEYSPTHQYVEPGTYNVSVTVFSRANNCPNTGTSMMTVIDNPEVDFSADRTEGCGPLMVNFTNLTEDPNIINYVWDFGDGSSQVFSRNPSHQFKRPGTYQVSLSGYTADSCFSDPKTRSIVVFPDPISEFEVISEVNCAERDTLGLRDLSQDAVAYQWSINGQIFVDTLPQILLDQAGEWPIELVVQNVFQCKDTSQQILRVLVSPKAAFMVDDSIGCEPFSVNFQDQSGDADRYFWKFGNGNTSTDDNPTQLFREAGIYEVQLIAKSSNGCPEDSTQISIEVLPKPSAAFSFEKPEVCGTPAEVVFRNESTDNQNNNWDFGDGVSSNETNPSYFYVDFGPKQVALIISNSFGCQDTSIQMVDIFGLPNADFDFSVGAACTFDSIQLINTSTESSKFIWKIGDNPFIELENPKIVYNEPGTYALQLIAQYNEVCQDTIIKNLEVYQRPTADFSYQADFDPSVLGEIQFTNRSILANRYLWNLGDGTITDEANVYHEYMINRSLDVELIAYNDNDGAFTCSDTINKPVEPEWLATFYAPNALAPDLDNDGVRFFKPVGTGLKSYEIQVYSPWGTIVWQSQALENGQPIGRWDGTYEGEKLPQGAYVWVATMTFDDGNEQRKSGTVTIIR
ncbi:MAG: PKD domain-containing protein, partial [Bacteroidota bacterium]